MEVLNDIVQIFVRAMVSVVFLFFLTKVMGAKQISQLTFFDYIVGITIGSIAAELASGMEIPFWHPVTAMATYALVDLAITTATRKSIMARRFFTGTPTVIIDDGKIIKENMKKTHYDINDLLSYCRNKGFYNVANIHYAILETNGELSILPKSACRPVTPADLDLSVQKESMVANVIIDGKVMKDNLYSIGKNEQWLKDKLLEQSVSKPKDILLATCDSNDNVSVYYNDEIPVHHRMFE